MFDVGRVCTEMIEVMQAWFILKAAETKACPESLQSQSSAGSCRSLYRNAVGRRGSGSGRTEKDNE